VVTWRRRKGEAPRTAAERRAARIATADLPLWAEQALNGLGRALRDAQRGDPPPDAYHEVELGAEALLAVAREMSRRSRL
jgi:hypothetical protein